MNSFLHRTKVRSFKHFFSLIIRHVEVIGVYGTFCALLVAVGLRKPEFKVRIPGTTKHALIRLNTTDPRVFKQVIFDKEYELGLPSTTTIIIDAGANIGLSAISLSLQHPAARIYSIEADAANYAMLCRNAELHHNIIPIHAALWDKECVLTVVDTGRGAWSIQVREDNQQSVDTVDQSVVALSIDSICHAYNLERIDLLKIDIEGAEFEVLSSSERWIDKVGTICIELHERYKPGCTALFAKVTSDFPNRRTRGELDIVSRTTL